MYGDEQKNPNMNTCHTHIFQPITPKRLRDQRYSHLLFTSSLQPRSPRKDLPVCRGEVLLNDSDNVHTLRECLELGAEEGVDGSDVCAVVHLGLRCACEGAVRVRVPLFVLWGVGVWR